MRAYLRESYGKNIKIPKNIEKVEFQKIDIYGKQWGYEYGSTIEEFSCLKDT